MSNMGRKNGYACQKCGGKIVTIDIDDGVTPFAILCEATKECDGIMFSAFYEIPQNLPAQFEWYRPTSTKGLDYETREHIHKGGLLFRKRKPSNHHMERTVGEGAGLEGLSAPEGDSTLGR